MYLKHPCNLQIFVIKLIEHKFFLILELFDQLCYSEKKRQYDVLCVLETSIRKISYGDNCICVNLFDIFKKIQGITNQ